MAMWSLRTARDASQGRRESVSFGGQDMMSLWVHHTLVSHHTQERYNILCMQRLVQNNMKPPYLKKRACMMHGGHTDCGLVILLCLLCILLLLGQQSIRTWVIAFSFCCLLPAGRLIVIKRSF